MFKTPPTNPSSSRPGEGEVRVVSRLAEVLREERQIASSIPGDTLLLRRSRERTG